MVSLSTGASFFSPIYPAILHEYSSYSLMVPLTLSLYLAGKAISSLIYGLFSDCFGRRLIMGCGMSMFILGSIVCFFNPSIELLILGRFLQGLGCSVAKVVGIATVNDLYQGKTAARTLSRAGNIHAITSSVLPILGGYLAAYGVWQSNFIVMAFLAMFALLFYLKNIPETLPPKKRVKANSKALLKTIKEIFRNHNFRAFILVIILCDFALECFFASSPVIFADYLKIPIHHFAYYYLIGSIIFILGSLCNRLLMRYYPIYSLMILGSCLFTIGSLTFMYAILSYPDNGLIQRLAMAPTSFGLGFLLPHIFAISLSTLSKGKGLAAALLGSISTLCCAVGVFVINFFSPHSFFPIAIVYFVTGIMMIVAFLLLKNYITPPKES